MEEPTKHDGETETAGERSAVPSVDDARSRLQALDDAPLEEHVGIYEDVHRQLQEGLADLDES